MTDVVSIKFKNRGKSYFFSPNGLQINSGDKVIVETSKGLEIADCCRGNHPVEDTAVVQPLRPVIRIATPDDLRVAQINKQREKEAFEICQKKIAEHGLDMKLVDVECNFEGNKTMFFFTSDGRVDFRELVKDLAGIFRNRIELRQIGVRDEAKMIGGIGICGRPYCCSQFLDEFQPVSTKMAKVQSLSLNPTKISGSCGRLMCCLRYEQEAYEDLIKRVPKQGAFVETKDGYGTAVQVDLLKQRVKVKLDEDGDDTLRIYKSNELCAVPGGRPKDGEAPPSVLNYIPEPEEEEEEEENQWNIPILYAADAEEPQAAEKSGEEKKKSSRNRRHRSNKPKAEQKEKAPKAEQPQKAEQPEKHSEKKKQPQRNKPHGGKKPESGKNNEAHKANAKGENKSGQHKTVKVEARPKGEKSEKSEKNSHSQQQKPEGAAAPKKSGSHRRRYYGNKPKAKPNKE